MTPSSKSPSAALSTTTSSGEALRLRTALVSLKDSLETTDRDVIVLLEEWQEALEEAQDCEKKSAELRAKADELDMRVYEWRQTAADRFQQVSAKLSSAALDVHLHTASFVAVDQQQALRVKLRPGFALPRGLLLDDSPRPRGRDGPKRPRGPRSACTSTICSHATSTLSLATRCPSCAAPCYFSASTWSRLHRRSCGERGRSSRHRRS